MSEYGRRNRFEMKFNHPQCYASSSAVLALLLFGLSRLWRRRHLAWLACDKEQQYIAPADGNRSNARVRSLPESKDWRD